MDTKYLDRAPKGLNRSFRDLGIELEGKISRYRASRKIPLWPNTGRTSSKKNMETPARETSMVFLSWKR
jgi:hypothetical protein